MRDRTLYRLTWLAVALSLGHLLDPEQPPVLGWLAFGWLVAFVTVLAVTCLYETRLWAQHRQVRRAAGPATGAGSTR